MRVSSKKMKNSRRSWERKLPIVKHVSSNSHATKAGSWRRSRAPSNANSTVSAVKTTINNEMPSIATS